MQPLFFRLVSLRYRHNIIVLYGLHVFNRIILFSVAYCTSFSDMVNVKKKKLCFDGIVITHDLSLSRLSIRNHIDTADVLIVWFATDIVFTSTCTLYYTVDTHPLHRFAFHHLQFY